jgi:hypothetical protein
MYPKTILFLTTSLAILVTLTGLSGIIRPSIYEAEEFSWQVQTVWQDYVDVVFIVPVLFVSGLFSWRGRAIALAVWAGTLLYLCYTYTIFAFAIHFNHSFLFYCIIIGLSFYGILWFIYTRQAAISINGRLWWLAIYLILTGAFFYCAWLAEILPGVVLGTAPAAVVKAGLVTNPVHVLDISVVLPGYIICGILLIARKEAGRLLAPILLSFGVLMSLTIAVLQIILFFNHLAHSLVVAVFLLVIAALDMIFLAGMYRSQTIFQSFQQNIHSK